MTSAIDRLNDDLYRAGDNDLLFVLRWPPNMNENAVTKHELLNDLHPAPLPDQPPPSPAPPPPLPDPTLDTLMVTTDALNLRKEPSATAALAGRVYKGQKLTVQGSAPDGKYHWARLIQVDGLKFADIAYVAREYLGPLA